MYAVNNNRRASATPTARSVPGRPAAASEPAHEPDHAHPVARGHAAPEAAVHRPGQPRLLEGRSAIGFAHRGGRRSAPGATTSASRPRARRPQRRRSRAASLGVQPPSRAPPPWRVRACIADGESRLPAASASSAKRRGRKLQLLASYTLSDAQLAREPTGHRRVRRLRRAQRLRPARPTRRLRPDPHRTPATASPVRAAAWSPGAAASTISPIFR